MSQAETSLPAPGSEPPLLKRLSVEAMVRFACVTNLVSLALMCWSVLDPTPLPVMLSMSLGQVIGTLALACYLGAVLLYQVRLRRARRGTSQR